MEFKDYYKIMGLEQGATQDEVKRAYRKLARKYHPDVSKEPDAETKFKELGEAYEVLHDPEKRAAYDRLSTGKWREGEEFTPPPGWDSGFEFSREFGGGGEFSDFFESLFGRGAPFHARRQGVRGEDHHARISIGVEDAYRGATRTITLQIPEIDASGHLVTRRHTLSVKIPAGVTEGQHIRLAGQGGPGVGNAPRGDLYLEVLFETHRLYQVQGRDIFVNLPITPWEAALGAKVTAPTLGGPVEVKIPAGAQSGQKLRLRGRGLPGPTPGDQYAVLQIRTPKAQTEEQKRAYEQLARTAPFDPRAELEG